MRHEPECPYSGIHDLCPTCTAIRAAYQRGREDAAVRAHERQRVVDELWDTNERTDCWVRLSYVFEIIDVQPSAAARGDGACPNCGYPEPAKHGCTAAARGDGA